LGGQVLEKAVILNKWEGQIAKVTDREFVANMHDLQRPDIIEIVRFGKDEVGDDDISLLREGAIFYWYVLSHTDSSRFRQTASRIWFQRKGRLSEEDYRRELDKVDEIWRTFGWNQP